MDKVSAPPGFVSQTSFWLQSIRKPEDDFGATGCSHEAVPTPMGAFSDTVEFVKLRNSFEQKPWLHYNQENFRNAEPNGNENKNRNRLHHLSRGVTHGFSNRSNCQKVSARWRPEDAHTTVLEDAPVFYPTDEEFEDMAKYIRSIRPSAEFRGVCRIVPPCSWAHSCPVPEGDIWDNTKFTTLIQDISELHIQFSDSETGKDSGKVTGRKRKLSSSRFKQRYTRVLDGLEFDSKSFGFDEGPHLSLKAFKKSAYDFRRQYFDIKRKEEGIVSSTANCKEVKLTANQIEGEYWRIIEDPTESLEVLAGADLDTRILGSGFPAASKVHETTYSKLLKSDWNLQNTSKLTDSLLTFETNSSPGVLYPRLYFGMCFSSLCWQVEDSLLYSLYYLHMGAPKVWYVIPGRYFLKFQSIVRKYYPGMVSKHPEFLYKLVRQLPISTLKAEGIPVYRCVQSCREFVLVFPGAYHSAFDCGFNCVELGNYAPIDWLPYGHMAMELSSESAFKASISPDKLMLEAANEAVKSLWKLSLFRKKEADPDLHKWKNVTGKDGILVKALRVRLLWIESRKKYFCNFLQTKKMDSVFDALGKRECCICHYDIYLSAVGCTCSTDRFTCLNHVKQLCACYWRSRIILLRYDVCQFELLVEALEGKLSAIYKWARENLGLLVQSHVNLPVRDQ